MLPSMGGIVTSQWMGMNFMVSMLMECPMVREEFSGKIIFITLGISKTECYQGQESFWFLSGDFYKGNFKEDNQHGHGDLYFADGEKYSGQFRNGYPNGKGCWIEANGDKYVGQFQDGEYHGRGYKISGSIVCE